MWALIAFIALGIVVATLIEINERIKAKKSKAESRKSKADCPQEKPSDKDCSACDLLSVCEKK